MEKVTNSKSTHLALFRYPISLLALTFLLGCSTTSTPTVKAEIFDYGIEARTGERIINDTASPSGKKRLIKQFQFKESTDKIPATLGTAFSICVRISGLPRSARGQIRHEISHPPMLAPDGKIWTTHTSAPEFLNEEGDSIITCVGYGFDHPFEIVKGSWTLSTKLSEKTLVSKVFTVE